MAAPDTGNTATIAFGTSSFSVDVHRIGGLSMTLPVLNGSKLSTTYIEEKYQGDLWDIDELTCDYWFDPEFDVAAKEPPISAIDNTAGAAETITLTYPTQSGHTSGLIIAGSGFIHSYTHPELANNQLNDASFGVTFNGLTGPTWTDPADTP